MKREGKVFIVSAVLLLVMFLIPSLLAAQSVNLLLNGSFEDGNFSLTGFPSDWTPDAFDPSATLIWDNSQAHLGSKSVKIEAPTPNDARWISQTVTVQPNTNYLVSGWIKTENVAHSSQSVDAGANLSLFGTWTRSEGLFGTNDWTYVSFVFNSGSDTQVTIAARLGYWSGTTTGTVWFDDLQLTLIDPSGPHPRWKILVLIYGTTDFTYTDSSHVGSVSDWTSDVFAPSATLTWDNSQAYLGSKSVKIEAPTPNDARWISQTVTVQPNTNYLVSGWIKTENVAHSSQAVDAGANLSLFGTWTRSEGLFGTNDWTYVSFVFNSGTDIQVTIAARLGYWSGTTTGTVWFDDLQLTPVSGAPVNLLKNGSFEDADTSIERHVVASMTPDEKDQAASAATLFVKTDIPALTSGNMIPILTIRYPDRALTELSGSAGSGWWPAPENTAPERDPAFDSVIVIWDPRCTDQNTGEYIWIGNAAGFTPFLGTGQTYTTLIIEAAISYGHRNVFKHEYGHSISEYFDASGTAPKPKVENHTDATQYVNCYTGQYYVWEDDTEANPIPNSIYNNDSGFTHDYYSGTTALASQPTRCLGITSNAWASGGPVSKPGTPTPEIINDLVTFKPIKSTYTTTSDTSDCGDGFVGQFSFDARLTNKCNSSLNGLVVEVTELTNNNVLQNADGGAGGVGSRLTVQNEGDYADGVLSPGESVDVNFIICLTNSNRFRFVVDVLGSKEAASSQALEALQSTGTEPRRVKLHKRGFFGRFRPK
ncbi:carbohydrate binding domain-containing protein [Candidatus Kuenenia sp.]|uniref:carbohydrate binding domain-containing protein n=1 Tax=Candidatus Kuenenia sp. TaxID=2499824 RepID=UPI00321FCC3E